MCDVCVCGGGCGTLWLHVREVQGGRRGVRVWDAGTTNEQVQELRSRCVFAVGDEIRRPTAHLRHMQSSIAQVVQGSRCRRNRKTGRVAHCCEQLSVGFEANIA